MTSVRFKLIFLGFLGLLAIPIGLIPSQVMNYLTGILQPGTVDAEFTVTPVIIIFFLSIVGVAVLDVIRTFIKGLALTSIVRINSLSLFDQVIKASPDFFRKNQASKISNRIVTEIRKTEAFLLDMKVGLPRTIVGLFIFSYVLFFGLDSSTPVVGSFLPEDFSQQGNWFLASLIIILSPLQAYFLLFDKQYQRVSKATAEVDDDVADLSYETVNSVREVQNNYAFDYAIFRLEQIFERLRKIEFDITKIDALFDGVGPILDGVVKVVLLAIGARLCVGDIELPLNIIVEGIEWKDYLGFAGIAVLVNGYVGKLKDYLFKWRTSRESFRRIDEFKKAEQLLDTSTQTLTVQGEKDSISFNSLDFETDDGIKILSDLNIEIKPGEHIAFVGPSGCGKSTTMQLILRGINKSSGKLSFNEKDIEYCDFQNLSNEVAMVQQKPVLLNTTVRNNLLLGIRKKSVKTLQDGGAVVDISRLDNCEGINDLNFHLIDVIDKVGLKPDMARKALDNVLPETYKNSEIIQNIVDIRKTIRLKIAEKNSNLVQFFDINEYMNAASVLENLLFGVLNSNDTENEQNPLELIHPLIVGMPLYDSLLWLGKQSFVHDQSIAMRIKNTSPALFDVLDSYKVAGENKEELSGEVTGLASDDIQSLKKLKPRLQRILLELALLSNAEHAKSVFANPVQFVEDVLASRKALVSTTKLKILNFTRYDSVKPPAQLSLREIMLDGQVNNAIRAAHAQVDQLIFDVLQSHKLFDNLILVGLESPVGEEGNLLSGGQAMKVAIARVLLKKPNVLLLDEATAALDEKSQAKIVELIDNEYKDKTVIMISHRLSTIRNYSRIMVFDRGHIIQQGTYGELVEKPGLFQDLVRQERGEAPLPKTSIEITEDIKKAKHSGTEIQRAIALSPIFSGLHSEHIALLEHMSRTEICERDTVLFKRGDEGDEFFIILSGEIDFFVEAKDNGEEEIVDTFGPGQSFGELALFGEVSRTLGAKAKTDVSLCIINRNDLLKLIEINPEISATFLKVISRQVAKIRESMY